MRKRKKQEKTPEVLRDTGNLSAGQKRLGLASICGLSILLGFISGALVWLVLKIMRAGIDVLWTWLPQGLGLDHSLPYYLTVCVAGGLIIGLLQKRTGPLPDDLEQVMGRIKSRGGYPYDRLHVIAVCALLPLIFGGALGPEAGLTGLVAGLCCWAGDRLKCKGDQIAALAEAGLAATLGVIFHAPLFGIAQNLEPGPEDPPGHVRSRIVSRKTRVVIYCFGVAGAMLAFALLDALLDLILASLSVAGSDGAETVSHGGLPRFGADHAIGLSQWKWFVPLLAIGVAASLFYMLFDKLTKALGTRLSARPLISCLIPGLCMGLCGFLLPWSMFSGEHELSQLIESWQETTVPVLLLTAVIKLVLVSVCINFGWRGGSIFPIIFSGACMGYAFALLTGMDGAFAAAVVISSLYAYQLRKPVAVIMVLLLCFPVTYILPVGISAFVASKVPSPFARSARS